MVYRIHPTQITSSKFEEQQQYADFIQLNYLQNHGLTLNDDEEAIHLYWLKTNITQILSLKNILNGATKY